MMKLAIRNVKLRQVNKDSNNQKLKRVIITIKVSMEKVKIININLSMCKNNDCHLK